LATHDFAKIEITTQVRIFSALTLFKVEKEWQVYNPYICSSDGVMPSYE
jgi:hypothetical protein